MKLSDAIDLFIADWRSAGCINSDGTETAYRQVLNHHAEDVNNRDPRLTGREDCKRTLARWTHPNTQLARRAALVSFYDWMMEEGHRETNPARQTRRPRKRPTAIYRLTRDEVVAFLAAANDRRERRIAYLGVCAGARNQELRGFRGRHFTTRPGYVWFSADIAKGGKEAWIPVIEELEPIVAEIVANVPDTAFVLPRRFTINPPGVISTKANTLFREDASLPTSTQALQRHVHRIGRQAGIKAHITPHTMRHAFGDHVAKGLGLYAAQGLMRHSDVSTTQGYVGAVTPEELAQRVAGFRLTKPPTLSLVQPPETGEAEREGFEPSLPAFRPVKGKSRGHPQEDP